MNYSESLRALIGFSLVLLIIFFLQSCKQYPPPKSELCAQHSGGTLVCNDPRRVPQNYERFPQNGDLVTSPESFERVKAYCAELRTNLIKCERKK